MERKGEAHLLASLGRYGGVFFCCEITTLLGKEGLHMSALELAVKEEKARWPEDRPFTPHDEAFKKLLQTFFAEFIELFFPELDKLLDHRHTRF
ncbi:hypothetical protein HMSSN036_39200 [Paenibacillus macerans]|nr:hypothetical protein HMSSN036_39200 [Paenibacillus macerans]